MQVTHLSAGAPGRPNEDYVCTGDGWAAVLDGATAPVGVDGGCRHGVVWLVRHLAAGLARRLVLGDEEPLPGILAAAIRETASAHRDTCDLTNPDSPSSTVSLVRVRADVVEYLTLGDSPIVLWRRDGTWTRIADDRLAALPGGRPYSLELVRALRNRSGGFWVASTDPGAAYEAVGGTAPIAEVAEVGVFTDGVSRLVDWYGFTWPGVFAVLRTEGAAGLVDRVRAAEQERPIPSGKKHDDATVVHARLRVG